MVIEVRKHRDWPTYLVRIEDELYEMSEDANLPNGCCIYTGDFTEYNAENLRSHFLTGDTIWNIPIGMVSQIASLAERMGKDIIRAMWEKDKAEER
jgi:hypothetical protein